jgi:uncharacterized Tic20 family protein
VTQDNPTPPPLPPSDFGATPPPPPPPPPPVGYETPPGTIMEMNKDARTWAMVAHLSALVGLLGVPTLLGPLVVWLIKKDQMAFVDDQGKEALNFHLTFLFAALACVPLIFCFGLGIVILIGLGIVALVFAIIAAVKANEGIPYRYPLTLRLIK